ncbi:hypothetical protein PISL3812_05394 [Talaromyces islandicus]|uniref:Uncharacterized protein n=1 Tax=Talaromyces islandicus TaxID=28573 RepID=A0A0U1LYH1_TALIS|nr:hypothetical protein PISL3812_05394 [Talaromyces islandicus]
MDSSYPSTPSPSRDNPFMNPFDLYSLPYYIDSWIEVSSQPSTSSLSSAATTDDIITTGLRVERSVPGMQRRTGKKRLRHLGLSATQNGESSQASSVAGSSQDEYEESDSESDQVLSSSNEDVTAGSCRDGLLSHRSFASETASSGDDADDDDRLTALGPRLASTPFVPQPNVFSHVPQYSRSRSYNGPEPSPSLVSNSSQATAVRHNSSSTARATRRNSRTQHSPYNMISPNYQADHDAALRASLSTLLSLGTAVRGVPKSDSPQVPTGPPVAPASSFRLVSESVAMGEETDDLSPRTRNDSAIVSSDPRQPKSVRSNRSSTPSRTKRKTSKDRGSAHAASSKKSHRTNMTDSLTTVSPTLMTWVISAGVVVLFSAISFSAGYALGREVGHTEAGMGSVLGSASDPVAKARASAGCSRDAVQGSLKRLRWGSSAGVSVYN